MSEFRFCRNTAAAFLILAVSAAFLPRTVRADDKFDCVSKTGAVADTCLRRYLKALKADRDPAPILAETFSKAGGKCTAAAAESVGYIDLANVNRKIVDTCELFAEDLYALRVPDASGLTPEQLACRRKAIRQAEKITNRTVKAFGKRCILRTYDGSGCDRVRRDFRDARNVANAAVRIVSACGNEFDAVYSFPGGSVFERIQTFLTQVSARSRHYAQHSYPPIDFDPSAEVGPAPVGITTLELSDAARLNVPGTGPRPVTVEVYYPSTTAAVAGVPRELVQILGFDITRVPAYRDVDLAAGVRPLVVFSHGNNGVRIQSFFFAGHLASHGYIVASPDHHGNTFVDTLDGIVDPDVAVNRPADMSFVIDEMLAASAESGNFFEGSIDPLRIGASGHSFGGLTVMLLAGGDAGLGATGDSRVSAIFPQAPAAPFDDAFFATIDVPTLIVGGTIDETTPFPTNQQRPFDLMSPGASIVALAELRNAGHFSFSDFCEVPPLILGFLGGAAEACETRHLPWRYAQDITKYLSLNFFDATLRDDATALARLAPEVMAVLDDDLRYESK